MKNIVLSTESVALHVRRGDYISDELKGYYFQVDMDYYEKAMNYMSNKIENPVFYIFSDDIPYCKQAFANYNNVVYIDSQNSASLYEDFEIMRNCKNFIIPNSTFSWWAAYLSDVSNEKIVITSKNWYYDKELNKTCIEAMCLPDWIQL